MIQGNPFQGRASLTSAASASATLIAAVSGERFHLTHGLITITTGAATNTAINFMEVTSGATSAATFLNIPHATSGALEFNFGDRGWVASAVGSRIVMENTGDATVNAIFFGYHR